MEQRESGVRFDWEPAVGSGHEPAVRNSRELRDKPSLLLAGADVLDDRVRMDDIKAPVGKREHAAIRAYERGSRIASLEAVEIVDADRRQLIEVRIALKKVVFARKVVEARNAHVEHTLTEPRWEDLLVELPLVASRSGLEIDGQTIERLAEPIWQGPTCALGPTVRVHGLRE